MRLVMISAHLLKIAQCCILCLLAHYCIGLAARTCCDCCAWLSQVPIEGSPEAWELVFCDLNVVDSKAEGKLAAKLARKILPDCPHLALRERVMASLCQAHPVEALTCGLVMRKAKQERKLSPSCYDSMLLALTSALCRGNLCPNISCSSSLQLCVLHHQAHQHPDTGLAV